MKKPFAQEGPERAAISARASTFRAFLPKGTTHSNREGAKRDHCGNIVSRRRFVNVLATLIVAGRVSGFRAALQPTYASIVATVRLKYGSKPRWLESSSDHSKVWMKSIALRGYSGDARSELRLQS
jgi:hypothetical protein